MLSCSRSLPPIQACHSTHHCGYNTVSFALCLTHRDTGWSQQPCLFGLAQLSSPTIFQNNTNRCGSFQPLCNLELGGSRVTKQKRNVLIYSVLRACAVSLGEKSLWAGLPPRPSQTSPECLFLGAPRWWVQLYLIFCRNKENPEYDFL